MSWIEENLDNIVGLREEDKKFFKKIHKTFDEEKLSCVQIESDDDPFVEGRLYIVNHDMIMVVNENLQIHSFNGEPAEYCKEFIEFHDNGVPHRLGGPSGVYLPENEQDDFMEFYYLFGKSYKKEQYWNHPLLIDYVLKSIDEIQSEESVL